MGIGKLCETTRTDPLATNELNSEAGPDRDTSTNRSSSACRAVAEEHRRPGGGQLSRHSGAPLRCAFFKTCLVYARRLSSCSGSKNSCETENTACYRLTGGNTLWPSLATLAVSARHHPSILSFAVSPTNSGKRASTESLEPTTFANLSNPGIPERWKIA
jgi:hypothetical protein